MALFFDAAWFDQRLTARGTDRVGLAVAAGIERSELHRIFTNERSPTAAELAEFARVLETDLLEVTIRSGVAVRESAPGADTGDRIESIEARLDAIDTWLAEFEASKKKAGVKESVADAKYGLKKDGAISSAGGFVGDVSLRGGDVVVLKASDTSTPGTNASRKKAGGKKALSLKKKLETDKIASNLDKELFRSLIITAVDYYDSTAVSFIQTKKDFKSWKKQRRTSEEAKITVDHILGSSAIPLLFPPRPIENRFFGDGCVRNSHPCAPSITWGHKNYL